MIGRCKIGTCVATETHAREADSRTSPFPEETDMKTETSKIKATDLLKRQHTEVDKLFKRIETAKDDSARSAAFVELARNLVAHDAIEREIFYPACEAAMGLTDLLGEALVEHGVVEFSLYQADCAQSGDGFEFKVTVLKEIVQHHVEEEEKEFFPKVEKKLGKEALEELGARMEARFEAVKGKDFRPPLHKNLREVLAGAIHTGQNGDGAKKAPAKKTTSRARAS